MARITTAAALIAILCAAPAVAAPASVRVQGVAASATGSYQMFATSVAYDDQELSSAENAKALLARIETASRFICGERQGRTFTTLQERQFETCLTRAVAGAVGSVNAPELTKVAAAR
jgi:UrcA family protein